MQDYQCFLISAIRRAERSIIVRSDYGRPRKMSKEAFAEQYKKVIKKEIGTLALMRELNLNRDTFFRYVREYKNEHQTKGGTDNV